MSVTIRRVALDSEVGAGFVEAVQQEYVARYGGRDGTPIEPAQFAPPAGAFLVADLDGVPVGCGGFRDVGDGTAEIKRMYVAPAARGRGIARQILRALESAAEAAGCVRVVLETGTEQPEALGLYTSSGYAEVPAFGVYRCSERSRYFGKALAAESAVGGCVSRG